MRKCCLIFLLALVPFVLVRTVAADDSARSFSLPDTPQEATNTGSDSESDSEHGTGLADTSTVQNKDSHSDAFDWLLDSEENAKEKKTEARPGMVRTPKGERSSTQKRWTPPTR